jgi:hypothetical protein
MNSRPPRDHDVVVTYTRVSDRRRPKRSVARAPAEDAAPELILDGAEVHSVDPDEPVAFDFVADDRLRVADGLVEDFIEDGRRPDWLRYGVVGASLAVIAGVGILAATVGVATMLPGGSPQGAASGEPALALNSPDPGADLTSATGSIREIPMSSGAPEAAWHTEVAPPIPRPRPDDVPARAVSEPGVTAQSSAPAPEPVGASEPPPASSDVALPPRSPVSAPVAAAPGNGGTDSLITSIEETLARIDSEASPAPSEIQPPQAQLPAASPPVVMIPSIYPPPADVAPPPATGGMIEPPFDATPPPATVDGYGIYSTGPVPPEPVPDFYPQAPQLNPADPGFYPSDSYAFPPPETVEETEVRRPGLLRRTLAKATTAVGRVFDRD